MLLTVELAYWPMARRRTRTNWPLSLGIVAFMLTVAGYISWPLIVQVAGVNVASDAIVVSHGEGRVELASKLSDVDPLVGMRFVDHELQPAIGYPANPNGSPGGMTGLCNEDGRFTILMPHPERVYRTVQNSWHDQFTRPVSEWDEDSPWMRLFRNARVWID